MPRATKIVATLGPASSEPEVLERMIRAGVDVVRLNFSHGTAQDHIDRATLVREVAHARRHARWRSWPTCRARRSASASSTTARCCSTSGATFVLDAQHASSARCERVGLDYKELPRDVKPGDTLLLNDGLIVLDGRRASRGDEVHTTVRRRRRAVEQQGHQQGRAAA